MIKNNVKKQYLKIYPYMSIRKIEKSIMEFDEYIKSEKISEMSSNYQKYVRGWLMREHSLIKNKMLIKELKEGM